MFVNYNICGGDVHKTIQATFEIVTPMFLGGADQAASKISGSSFKGALSFWWRALYYARFVSENDGKLDKALKAMQKEEQALFGGPDGQGAFLLKITQPDNLEIHPEGTVLNENANKAVGVGARYLGYGIINAFHTRANPQRGTLEKKAGQLERSCMKAGITFTVQLLFRCSTSFERIATVSKSLQALGLFGGMGSRVRRGWGSLALMSLSANNIVDFEPWASPVSRADYVEAVNRLITDSVSQKVSGSNFSLTAFCCEVDIRVGTERNNNALISLDNVGSGFQRYRGFRGAGERNFQTDHDWFRVDNGRPNTPPKRSAFGLPHNYSKNLGVTAADVKDGNKKIVYDRRASPLFFHIHKVSNGDSFGVILYFPNTFLSTDQIGIVRRGRKTSVAYQPDIDVVRHFLENTKPDGNRPSAGAYFPSDQILAPTFETHP